MCQVPVQMQDLSCVKYLKAADSSPVPGSSISLCSTASGSSASTTSQQSCVESSNENEANVAKVVTYVSWTEIDTTVHSINAQPSMSTKALWQKQLTTWSSFEEYFKSEQACNMHAEVGAKIRELADATLSAVDVEAVLSWLTQHIAGRREEDESQQERSPTYNERAQEEVYLQSDRTGKPMYNEALQEEVYLSADASEQEAVEEDSGESFNAKAQASLHEGGSPTKKSKRKSKEQGAPSSLSGSIIFEPFPVKHTFIHFAESNLMEENLEKLPIFSHSHRQMCRARSAPANLTQIYFSGFPFSKGMAKIHLMGTCKPCSYIHHKTDGCRQGAECKFCHLCPANEKRKRRRQQRIRLQREKFGKLAAPTDDQEEGALCSAKNALIENSRASD